MNILILGATGRVGRHILARALNDGHQVTALVRSPEKITLHTENLKILQGNVLNQGELDSAMAGIDAVVGALNTDGTNTLSQSMPLILEVIKSHQIARIITIGTAGILQSRISSDALRYQSAESRNRSTRATEEHHKVYELVKASDLDWTIVCPTALNNDPYTGIYRIEADFLPENGVKISVEDTAELAYQQLFSEVYLKKRIGIAY